MFSILCLHGMGTSGTIFDVQTASFRSKLDPSLYHFDFIDAPHKSMPAFGVEIFFPPPNYTFWNGIDPTDVAEAHRWLHDYFDTHEPYDAVMCFSQGCALISSFILHHNNERPDQTLPFKGAIFICGGIPLQVLADLGLPISREAWAIHNASGQQLNDVAGSAAAEIQALMKAGRDTPRRGLWDKTEMLQHEVTDAEFPSDTSNIFGLDFTRFPENLKIDIPTVHIYGIKDPRYPASIQLAHFSNESSRKVFDHKAVTKYPGRQSSRRLLPGWWNGSETRFVASMRAPEFSQCDVGNDPQCSGRR